MKADEEAAEQKVAHRRKDRERARGESKRLMAAWEAAQAALSTATEEVRTAKEGHKRALQTYRETLTAKLDTERAKQKARHETLDAIRVKKDTATEEAAAIKAKEPRYKQLLDSMTDKGMLMRTVSVGASFLWPNRGTLEDEDAAKIKEFAAEVKITLQEMDKKEMGAQQALRKLVTEREELAREEHLLRQVVEAAGAKVKSVDAEKEDELKKRDDAETVLRRSEREVAAKTKLLADAKVNSTQVKQQYDKFKGGEARYTQEQERMRTRVLNNRPRTDLRTLHVRCTLSLRLFPASQNSNPSTERRSSTKPAARSSPLHLSSSPRRCSRPSCVSCFRCSIAVTSVRAHLFSTSHRSGVALRAHGTDWPLSSLLLPLLHCIQQHAWRAVFCSVRSHQEH